MMPLRKSMFIIFTAALLIQCKSAQAIISSKGADPFNSIDNGFEKYMKQLPNVIRDWGFDPANVPDTSRNIGGFWFTFGTSIDVNLQNGRLHGLSNLNLIGELNAHGNLSTIVESTFVFPQLKVYHESLTRVLFRNVYRKVNSTLRDVKIKIRFFIDTTSKNEVVKIKTEQLGIGNIDMTIIDDSNSNVMKYFLEEVRPRILQIIPDFIDEASSYLMRNLRDKLNEILPEHRQKLLNDMGLLSRN